MRNSKFQLGIAIHKKVVHEQHLAHNGKCVGITKDYPRQDKQGVYDKTCLVCQEEKFIKKLSVKTCETVCKECFGPVNGAL